jgi:hypothetical protein
MLVNNLLGSSYLVLVALRQQVLRTSIASRASFRTVAKDIFGLDLDGRKKRVRK